MNRTKNVYGKVATNQTTYENGFGITYHDTEVISIRNGVITLNSGGWRTLTTKTRINQFLPNGCNLYQKNNIWYITTPKDTYLFSDGIKINSEGIAINAKSIDKEEKRIKTLKKKIDGMVKQWSNRIDKNDIASGGGECWGISMGIQDCKDCEHLLKNCGGGYRFINQALTKKGYRIPAIFFCSADSEGHGKPDIKTTQQHKETILRTIRSFYVDVLITKKDI